ncbi:MAG: hypothetical protein JNN12_04730 [Bacteroidetes Order II. Incertae sedis bacterium]|nr:hypothetical protein [Bacteroidetes Order II. bacterium]
MHPICPIYRLVFFRFEIRCTTEMHLRPFVASVLRGAFGSQFRRLVCLTRMETCEGCMLRSQCPCGVLFEPAPDTLTLHFLTATHLKHNRQQVRIPEFHHII